MLYYCNSFSYFSPSVNRQRKKSVNRWFTYTEITSEYVITPEPDDDSGVIFHYDTGYYLGYELFFVIVIRKTSGQRNMVERNKRNSLILCALNTFCEHASDNGDVKTLKSEPKSGSDFLLYFVASIIHGTSAHNDI